MSTVPGCNITWSIGCKSQSENYPRLFNICTAGSCFHWCLRSSIGWMQANPAVLVDNLIQDFQLSADGTSSLTMRTSVAFTVMAEDSNWSAEKAGPKGKFNVCAHTVALSEDTRLYQTDGEGSDKAASYPKQRSINHTQNHPVSHPTSQEIGRRADGSLRFRKQVIPDETPASMPVIRLDVHEDLEMSMELDMKGISALPKKVLQEVQLQIPREMFDLTNLVCATYIDSRLLILRGVSGAALLFIRSPVSWWQWSRS